MITQEQLDELASMMRWHNADPQQASRIGHYYHLLINPSFNFCGTCPTNVSFCFAAIKEWYINNHDSVIKQLAEVELLKAKANEPTIQSDNRTGKTKNKKHNSK